MVVKTNIIEDEDKLYVKREQDVQPILQHIHNLNTSDLPNHFGDSRMRYVGEIPLVLAEQWSKESGLGLGSKEFMEYCRKKLQDPDYKKLLVRGF
tara:strand:- start:1653 stop:1937 length:285 start_codon:yes stop_codon:yes gene_type:complete